MNAVLVDTDIFIEVLRGHNRELVQRWLELVDTGSLLFYSPVTAAELMHGIDDSERPDLLLRFAEMTCAPLDLEVGLQAGNYLQQFHRSHGLQMADALIAATATVYSMCAVQPKMENERSPIVKESARLGRGFSRHRGLSIRWREAAQEGGSHAAVHRLDEPARLSLGMVASLQSPLPFHPARSL